MSLSEDILTIQKRQEAMDSSAFSNPQRSTQSTQLEESLSHLRLDYTPPQSIQCSLVSPTNTGEAASRSGARGFLAGGGSRGSRANSPGRSGGGGGEGRGIAASAGKVMRRKRTGRFFLVCLLK